jgi:hypothetical protein
MPERNALQEFWQYLGQVPAGLAQTTIANASTEEDKVKAALRKRQAEQAGGVQEFLYNVNQTLDQYNPINAAGRYLSGDENYVPAIVKAPGAVAGIVKTLVDGEVPDPSTYLGDSVAGTMNAIDRTNSYLGITDPENAAQVVLNIAGGLAVPGPKMGLTGATSQLGKVGQGAVNVAGELVLPLRNTPMSTALPVSGAIGVGINEAVNTQDDDYFGLADLNKKPELLDEAVAQANLEDMLAKGAPYDQIIKYADEQRIKVDEGLLAQMTSQRDQQSIATMQQAIASGMPTEQLQELAKSLGGTYVEGDRTQPIQLGNASGLPTVNDTPMTTGEKVVLGAAAIAGVSLAGMAGAKVLKRLRQGTIMDGATGTRTFRPRDNLVQQGIGKVVQADQPIRNLAREVLSPEDAKQYEYRLDRIVGQATAAKVQHTLATGEFPNSAIKTEPLAPVLEAMAKDLDPTEFQMVTDALLYKSALDDVARTGTQSAFNDKTPADMLQLVNIVETDPKLGKYTDLIREQYQGVIKYALDQGLISPADYAKMRNQSPNYVHFGRSVRNVGEPETPRGMGNDGSQGVKEMFSRATEQFEGVQVGAVDNPIDGLSDRIGSVIKYAEQNALRRDMIKDVMNNGAGNIRIPGSDGKTRSLIKEITDPQKAAKAERVITVYDKGVERFYQIGDPALYNSMLFAPRATMPVLGTMRNIAQYFTTGAGNVISFFGMTTSPVYDTLVGVLTKPQGYDIGLINEVLNKAGSPVNLGRFDPTQLITAPIGALRNLRWEMTQAAANTLTEQLIRNSGFVRDWIGPQRTTALRDTLQNAYNNSLKSILDQMGATSKGAYGGDTDAVKSLPVAMQDIAPNFYSQMNSRIYREAMQGNPTLYEAALATSKYAFHKSKSALISRMYMAAVRNMQEGFRYQYAATNINKIKNAPTLSAKEKQLNELASNVRRISVDAAQHGSSQGWNMLADSVMYANIGVQSLAHIGRSIKNNPVGFTMNTMALVGTLAALRYGAMAVDPEVRRMVSEKTDTQNTSAITTFGGMELPIEPALRVITGPLFATLDAIAMDEQGNINEDFFNVWMKYFEEGPDVMQQERMQEAASTAATAGLMANDPLDPSGIPLANVILSLNGIDPQMSRIAGQGMMQRPQQADPTAGEGRTTGSLVTAEAESMINSVLGSGVMGIVKIADDTYRAVESDATTPLGAFRIAMQRYEDQLARGSNPVASTLLGGYTTTKSLGDTDYNILKKKMEGVDKADVIFDQEILRKYQTNADPRLARLDPVDIMKPEYEGTYLASIGAITQTLQKELRKLDAMLTPINKQVEEVRAGHKITNIEDRNKLLNQLNEERAYINMQKLTLVRIIEDQIRETIGDPSFTYQDFDMEKYNKPMQP